MIILVKHVTDSLQQSHLALLQVTNHQLNTLDFLYKQLKEIRSLASTCKHQPRYTYVCQQKQANPMEIVESTYKWLDSWLMVFTKSTERLSLSWKWVQSFYGANAIIVLLKALDLILKQCFWAPGMAKMCVSCCIVQRSLVQISSFQQE